jgi:DNA-binding IclR family transcriptional regulator
MPQNDAVQRNPGVASSAHPTGAQSIHRAFEVLRIIAEKDARGMRLIDVAASAGLTVPTAHRILNTLEQEGAIVRVPEGKRYVIGPEITLLGLSTPMRIFRAVVSPTLRTLCDEIGDAVFLSVPSRLDTVCADRKIGSYPIQVLSIEIGSRRPLGISANGAAILSRLPDDMVNEILRANTPRLAEFPTSIATIRERIKIARKCGYVFIEAAMVKNTRALAVPIYDITGNPVAAVSTIAVAWRLPKNRIRPLLHLLRTAAGEISRQLQHSGHVRA